MTYGRAWTSKHAPPPRSRPGTDTPLPWVHRPQNKLDARHQIWMLPVVRAHFFFTKQ